MAYGYTDDQILDHVERAGIKWLNDSTREIMRSRQAEYRFQATVQGLARTPYGKEDSRALKDLADMIYRYIDSLTAVIEGDAENKTIGSGEKRPYIPGGPLDKETYDKIAAGTTKVMIGSGESKSWDLFAGADFIKE